MEINNKSKDAKLREKVGEGDILYRFSSRIELHSESDFVIVRVGDDVCIFTYIEYMNKWVTPFDASKLIAKELLKNLNLWK